ncbi:YciI family protein [Mucilaginibacter sp. Mucisp86]|uniref:YciI family protein n=1 Tax=Mucilaginibacter sp. Mucisp86 TaxID=3243060 RepID=UPI0039B6A03A
MNEFLLIFRRDAEATAAKRSPEQMQTMMNYWREWIGGIATQNKLVAVGNRLDTAGSVIKPDNVVTDGPYVEVKEAIGGYTIIKASTLEEATELSKGCPILSVGGSVEVRPIIPMEV